MPKFAMASASQSLSTLQNEPLPWSHSNRFLWSCLLLCVRRSLGTLMYEMVAGHPPFRAKTLKDLNRKILNDKVLLPKFLSSEVRQYYQAALAYHHHCHFQLRQRRLPQQGTQATIHGMHRHPLSSGLTGFMCSYASACMQAHAVLKGFLERNVQKRLGGSKSTMFEVGGVAAIKAHRWFGKIPWSNLLRKQGEGDTHRFENTIRPPRRDMTKGLVRVGSIAVRWPHDSNRGSGNRSLWPYPGCLFCCVLCMM